MVLLSVAFALAGPTRCVATWEGPAPACGIRGEVKATVAAGSEGGARRAAMREVLEAARLSAAATRARIPTLEEAAFSLCEEAVKAQTHLSCYADQTLADPDALCFVELRDPECWSGEVLQLDGGGWQAVEAGRKLMCDAVDARLVAQNYTDVAARRVVCKASCQARTSVSCPSGQ